MPGGSGLAGCTSDVADDHDGGSFRLPAGCPLQGGDLPEELQSRLGGATNEGRAWGHVRHDARLGPDLCCLPDPQVAGQRRLSADLDEVLQHGRARDAHLRHHHAAPAEADVVPDLHQVIEAGARADDGVAG